MKKQRGDFVIELVGGVFAVLTLIVVLVIENASCKSRWADSGLECSWGPIQGCLVHFPDGRKIPDDRVREIDVPKVEK